MEGLILIGIFVILLLINVPICYALGASSVAYILIFKNLPLAFITQALVAASDSFPLMAVPFFILAGDIMASAGISKRLVDFCKSLVGHITGGLGMVTIIACGIFAAISGSGPATVAAIGGIMIPEMIKEGYDTRYSSALSAASGTLGPIIPPSISFIMYAVVSGQSITKLFAAGFVPGFLMIISLMLYNYYTSKKYNFGQKVQRVSTKDIFKSFNYAKGALFMPIIILGGIYAGIFTPTEASVVACIYGIIVGMFIYKDLKFKDLFNILKSSSLTAGTVLLLVGCATAFGQLLTFEQVPKAISEFMLGLTNNKYVMLMIINIFLFIVGMLMETLAAIIIFAPLLLGIVLPLGIDPLHFGVIMVVNLVIGMCTPPVGVNLFVGAGLGKVKIEDLMRWALPMIGMLIISLLIVTYLPSLVLFLPNLLK